MSNNAHSDFLAIKENFLRVFIARIFFMYFIIIETVTVLIRQKIFLFDDFTAFI